MVSARLTLLRERTDLTLIMSRTDRFSWLSIATSCMFMFITVSLMQAYTIYSDLTRRGCIRTAFEVTKLLYSLDPSTDPHGSLLHLDFLALKTSQTHWLLELWDAHLQLPSSRRLSVQALPNWHYSRALALYMQEGTKGGHEESTKALVEAVKTFPMVVPLLADKTDFAVSDEVRRHPAFRIQLDAR